MTFAVLRDRAVVETVEVDARQVQAVARIYGEAARRNRKTDGPRYQIFPVVTEEAEAY